jgi:hypothetical protein
MLTEEEENFLKTWEINRVREKSFYRQISGGLPIGILMGIGILLNFVLGWYKRATIVAHSESTPLVLILAVVLIALFYSVFSKRHQWEMKEQRYIALTKKRELENSSALMQQDSSENSQLSSETQIESQS